MSLLDIIGMPFNQIFPGLLLPMLIVFAILWALLNTLRVFPRKINLVLSLTLTIMAAMTPQFNLFTMYVTQVGIQVAIVAFFLLFTFGSIMWMIGRGRSIYYQQVSPTKRMELLVKRKDEYKRKAREAADRGDDEAAMEWNKRWHEVDDEIVMLSTKK